MKIKNNKSGFSLFELSVVILIIMVLMLGIFQGNKIYNKSKILYSAALTKSSIVGKIEGLLVWFETTMPNSFNNIQAVDEGNVTTWFNIGNPSTVTNNATGTATYVSSAMNDLPALRFNGSSNVFSYDGTRLANSDYTIFVVAQRRAGSASGRLLFLGGSSSGSNANLSVGYAEYNFFDCADCYIFDHYANTTTASSSTYTGPIPTIHSYRFTSKFSDASIVGGRNYYVNGFNKALSCYSCTATPLSSYDGAQIGKYTDNINRFFIGDIGEVIIFTRYLSDQERQDVETYLGKKWGITVASS